MQRRQHVKKCEKSLGFAIFLLSSLLSILSYTIKHKTTHNQNTMSNRNRFFSSSNPFVSEERYEKSSSEYQSSGSPAVVSEGHMTVQGAVNKSFILTGILLTTAIVGWQYTANTFSMALMWVGLIGGLISFFVGMFNPKSTPITAPLYAAFEGLLLGSISMVYAFKFEGSAQMSGIVLNAIMLTMFALGAMLIAYRTKLIVPTETFKSVIITATMAIGMVYLSSLALGLFGVQVPYLHSGGPIGIAVSVIIVGIASLNLILDFEAFEKGEEHQAPKYMEWFSAMGLLVTLVWLYLEILRLLSKLKSD